MYLWALVPMTVMTMSFCQRILSPFSKCNLSPMKSCLLLASALLQCHVILANVVHDHNRDHLGAAVDRQLLNEPLLLSPAT